ncbi:hypothetical protein, partial [uncultured Amaricoccus sp.]|uniref:hypothetical protein n=1 Tax=uncultured Amaricoccus sp. TaxID=339341 RepID=UPI00261ED2A2
MMALIGAGLFFVLLAGELPGRESADWDDLPTGIVVRYIVTMALGSAVAGWLLAGLFGRRGAAGWLLALLGAVAATMVAGLLGSALGLLPDLLRDGWQSSDLIPILFGLAVLPLAFVGKPLLLAAWLGLIALTHVWARQARGR